MPKQNYANIEWTVDDVIENSKQFGIRTTKNDAKKVLALKEQDITDAMVKAGWQVIEDTLLQREASLRRNSLSKRRSRHRN